MAEFRISVHVSDEDTLYNPFDAAKQTLSAALTDYITSCYTEKHFHESAVLVFSGTHIDGERLKKALLRYIQKELEHNDRRRKRNVVKMLRLLVIGLLFVSAGILLGKRLNSILLEVLSIIGSFAVWEAANIWIVENPETALRERFLKRLMETSVIVE